MRVLLCAAQFFEAFEVAVLRCFLFISLLFDDFGWFLLRERQFVDAPRLFDVPVGSYVDGRGEVEDLFGLHTLCVVARVPLAIAIAVVEEA